MITHYVVVYDPKNEFAEGAVVDAASARKLEAAGVVALPCVPSLFRVGVGGFHKRAWGGGYPLESRFPTMHAPLTIHARLARPAEHVVYWAARFEVDPKILEEVCAKTRELAGTIRFNGDTGQAGTVQVAISSAEPPIDFARAGAPDEAGGWIKRGASRLSASQDGFMGFAFYGTAPGVRVLWAAASIALAG